MRTYMQIKQAGKSTQKHLFLKDRSWKTYLSAFKHILIASNVSFEQELSPQLFKRIEAIPNVIHSENRSAFRHFYSIVVQDFVSSASSITSLIQLFDSGICEPKYLASVEEEIIGSSHLLNLMRSGRITNIQIERALFLPPNSLARPQESSIKLWNIPDQWWSYEIASSLRGAKKDAARHIYLAADLRSDAPEALDYFLDVCQKVAENDYSGGNLHKIIEHKARINYIGYSLRLETLDEFKKYENYKYVDMMMIEGRNWDREKSSASHARGKVEKFYSFLLLTDWQPIAFKESELSLKLFSSHRLVQKYVEYWKEVKGNYDSGSLNMINMAISLLDEEYGWVFKQQDDIRHLPEGIYREVMQCGGWEEYCRESKEKLKTYRRYISSLIIRSRDSKERSSVLLNLSLPVGRLVFGLQCSLDDLESRFAHTKDFAHEAQQHLLMFMMTCFPLRASNWSQMRISPILKSGSLILDSEDVLNIVVPKKQLKNGRTNAALRSIKNLIFPISQVVGSQRHIDFLYRFLKELRPLINKGNSLFCIRGGNSCGPAHIGNMTFRWSKKYLSSEADFPSRTPGLPPFRSHIIRAAVATENVRHDRIDVAAILLADSRKTIEAAYVKDDANQKLKRAATQHISSYFKPS